MARCGCGVKRNILWQPKTSSSAGDWKVTVKGATAHAVGSERDDGSEVLAEHWESEDGVDGHVRAESEGDGDGGARLIDARSATADDGCKVAVIGRVEISRITNGPTKFNWFKGIRIVELDEFGNQVGLFRLKPKMEKEAAGLQGAGCVHETTKFNSRWLGV